jgi:iron complex outermembrane receptor protein
MRPSQALLTIRWIFVNLDESTISSTDSKNAMQTTFRLKLITLAVLEAAALSAHAADAPAPAAAAIAVVEVTGSGQTRQVQNVTRVDLLEAVPGTSPLKVLEKLPGVSFQSADPFGAYEWSTRISIRGFNQSQLGFTLDGIPLGDMSYGNNNGLHISRAISSENIGRIEVSQGAGALGTASTSNLGGTIQFFTQDPGENRGLAFAQTVGSDSTSRTFVRLDSGRMDSGTKLYLSATRQRAEKWKGQGDQNQDQFNAKFVQAFGDNTLSGFINYSKRVEVDYQDLSLDMVNRLGYNWDNYAPDWQRALNAAAGKYSGGVNNMDDAYYEASGLRRDWLGGLTLDVRLSPSSTFKATAYHHANEGQGHWYTPYTPTSPTAPISIRTTEYSIGRDGVLADWTWETSGHTVAAGFWGERNLHTLTRNFYAANGPEDTNYFLSNPMSTGFKQDFTTTTTQYYLQDTMALLDDRLTVTAGFKSPKVHIDAVDRVGTRAQGSITAHKTFLPQVGVNYKFSPDVEGFASVSRNMRAFQPGVSGPFSQTQTAFDAGTPNLKPETSTNMDLGVRFHQDALQGSLAVYRADFQDRLMSVAACAGIVGCPSTFVNVGKVETQGLEAVAVWKFSRALTWFNSFTFNDSTYKSDYTDNNKLVAIGGKHVVDTPRTMFDTELAYEHGGWFARLNAKYTDKRYYTYTNDAGVPSYWLASLSGGVKFRAVSMFKELTLQANVSNLFDKRYLGTIGSNGFATSDPSGSFATMLTGAPRQFFVTLNGKL